MKVLLLSLLGFVIVFLMIYFATYLSRKSIARHRNKRDLNTSESPACQRPDVYLGCACGLNLGRDYNGFPVECAQNNITTGETP